MWIYQVTETALIVNGVNAVALSDSKKLFIELIHHFLSQNLNLIHRGEHPI